MCLGVPHRASYFYLYLSPVYLPSYCLHYPTPFTLLFYYQPNSYHSPLRCGCATFGISHLGPFSDSLVR